MCITDNPNTYQVDNNLENEKCFLCNDNNSNFTYSCCKKKVCMVCAHSWKTRKNTCPFCVQLPTNLNNIHISNGSLSDRFIKWQETNNYQMNHGPLDRLPNYIYHLNNIDKLFDSGETPIYLQVANNEKIHIFKYHNRNEINFKYDVKYHLVEITGGEYYKHGKIVTNSNFGWWLHGYIGKTNFDIELTN